MKAAARIALLPVCILVAATFVFSKKDAPETQTPGKPASIGSNKEVSAAAFRLPATAGHQQKVKIEEARRDAGASLTLSPDPAIQEFSSIKRKSLRSQSDIADMKRLLRQRQVLQTAFDQLSNFDAELPARRDLVAFVQDALLDQTNPEREFIAARTEELILADNLRPEQNRPHRRELAADKGELVLAYLDARPGRSQFLIDAAAGSPNITVIRNALAVGERRRAESIAIIQELGPTVSN